MGENRVIKVSEIVTQCRYVLTSMQVVGPVNCKILSAVYDDLGIVEQYLIEQERRQEDHDSAADDNRNN